MATGYCKGRRIKAVAVSQEDFFDEDFGVKLAKMKYKVKEKEAKLRHHEQKIREYQRLIEWAEANIRAHNSYADYIDCSLMQEVYECEKFVNDYFDN